MKIAVIGCGRWGSFIAWYLDKIGNEVSLYGRESSEKMQSFLENRKNTFLELPKSITLTTDINDVFNKDLIIISVGTQSLRELLNENKSFDYTIFGATFGRLRQRKQKRRKQN